MTVKHLTNYQQANEKGYGRLRFSSQLFFSQCRIKSGEYLMTEVNDEPTNTRHTSSNSISIQSQEQEIYEVQV